MADDVTIELIGPDGQHKQTIRGREAPDGFRGQALVQLFDADGNLKAERRVGNLITTAGDEYYAKRGGAGVLPAAPADVTKVDGMKLGTGTTAVAKSGAGAALVTYETASNNPFDSTFPQFVDLSADGNLKAERRVGNKITTVGDEYYAKRSAAGVLPQAPADVTKVDGMKLGTGVTAETKSGTGAHLVTYITGSNNPFDSTHPSLVDLTGDTGWQIEYKTTWAAGDVTNSAITEAVICNNAATDGAGTSVNTMHRITFTAINKTASDTLVITWRATFNAA